MFLLSVFRKVKANTSVSCSRLKWESEAVRVTPEKRGNRWSWTLLSRLSSACWDASHEGFFVFLFFFANSLTFHPLTLTYCTHAQSCLQQCKNWYTYRHTRPNRQIVSSICYLLWININLLSLQFVLLFMNDEVLLISILALILPFFILPPPFLVPAVPLSCSLDSYSVLVQFSFLAPTLCDRSDLTTTTKVLVYVFVGTHLCYFVLTGTAMWQCATVTFCHISWRKLSLHSIEAGFPTLYPPPNLPFSFFCLYPLCAPLFSSALSFSSDALPSFLYFLSSVVFCLGMLATLQLYSSMHFISIFISDFVIIYSLIYLGLFMHAVCETDSCIYQWNRVRS